MSEKLYALLFRLYPSRFRDAYAEEAMQLFRDRSRDEHGFFAAMRSGLICSSTSPSRFRASIATCFARPLPHPFGNA